MDTGLRVGESLEGMKSHGVDGTLSEVFYVQKEQDGKQIDSVKMQRDHWQRFHPRPATQTLAQESRVLRQLPANTWLQKKKKAFFD